MTTQLINGQLICTASEFISSNPQVVTASLYGPTAALQIVANAAAQNIDFSAIPGTVNGGFTVSDVDPFRITFNESGNYNVSLSLVLLTNAGASSSVTLNILNAANQPIAFGGLSLTDYAFGSILANTEITRQTNLNVVAGTSIRFTISAPQGATFTVPIRLCRLLIQRL